MIMQMRPLDEERFSSNPSVHSRMTIVTVVGKQGRDVATNSTFLMHRRFKQPRHC